MSLLIHNYSPPPSPQTALARSLWPLDSRPVWLIVAVVSSLAAVVGPIARSMDGRISAAAPLTLADQLPLPMIVQRGWSGFVPVRRAI